MSRWEQNDRVDAGGGETSIIVRPLARRASRSLSPRETAASSELKRRRVTAQSDLGQKDAELRDSLVQGSIEPASSSYSNEEYTVGWICAIKAEYVAAQSFLDEEHDRPSYISRSDNNDYTLGKFGGHNTVIAVLPNGEYGISSAASVARDMMHSFPNVRIGLMVGIGGGAPTRKHDIRLGDVVVSSPCNNHTGIFQYDFGKTIQNQGFQPTGTLDQPPTILRTAVNGLEALYERKGHQLEEAIDVVLEENPRLQRKYRRPDRSSDRLYRSEFTHPLNGDERCADICGDDVSRLVIRPDRTNFEDNLVVHYGLIASANQLMKDALIRDRLADEHGVLCFEMEAAGLMNHFPCLVVRGICDYSDSHKNKEWQGYAAMAAAAYAKDLLRRIPPSRVQAERRMEEILSGFEKKVDKLLVAQHDQEVDAVLDWLTTIDFGAQQSDNISRRQKGTGQWFLKSAEFQAWVETGKQTLFCPGIPGAGKTILTSIIIESLCSRFQGDADVGIAYIFCNFKRQDEQNIGNLLSSLLRQLTKHSRPLPKCLESLYNCHKDGRTRPSLEEISSALNSVAAEYSRLYILIDALDECQVSDGCRMKLLSEVFSIQAQHGANILATSRFIPDIRSRFEGSTTLEIRATDEDVQNYLAGQIHRLPSFVLENPDLQNNITTTISKKINGMFLLGPLHIDALAREPTVGHIELALQNLPSELDDTYKQAMLRIENQGGGIRELAKKVLTWLVLAKRVLSITEIRHAVAVEPGTLELNERFIPTIEVIGSVCAGLISIDAQSNAVRLVHYTTQEYFKKTQEYWFPTAEDILSRVCLTYLSFNVFGGRFYDEKDDFDLRLQSYPLYDYCARNWGFHARQSSGEVEALILKFLASPAKVSSSIQVIMPDGDDYCIHDCRYEPAEMSPLHLAAYFGLRPTMETLLRTWHDVDIRDGHRWTPLWLAAKEGHEGVVRLLLEHGADPNPQDADKRTPLWLAVNNGHEAVVTLLLSRGADPNPKPEAFFDSGATPIIIAVAKGYALIARLLLEAGADVGARDDRGYTPIQMAFKNDDEEMIKQLLENGVDVETKELNGLTLLRHALEDRNESMVMMLLEMNADIEHEDSTGLTPLLFALDQGLEAIFKLLLNKGLASQRPFSRTLLSYGERDRHAAIRKLWSQLRSNDSPSVNEYGTLLRAVMNAHIKVVEQMLDRNQRDLHVKPRDSEPLLLHATLMQDVELVQYLLKTGVKTEHRDRHGGTPLLHAARLQNYKIVRLLLDNDANVDARNNNGRTALSLAVTNENGRQEPLAEFLAIVRLLLKRGADMEYPDRDYRTPLSWAAEKGHVAVVNFLLDRGADHLSEDSIGRRPVDIALMNRDGVVREALAAWDIEWKL